MLRRPLVAVEARSVLDDTARCARPDATLLRNTAEALSEDLAIFASKRASRLWSRRTPRMGVGGDGMVGDND